MNISKHVSKFFFLVNIKIKNKSACERKKIRTHSILLSYYLNKNKKSAIFLVFQKKLSFSRKGKVIRIPIQFSSISLKYTSWKVSKYLNSRVDIEKIKESWLEIRMDLPSWLTLCDHFLGKLSGLLNMEAKMSNSNFFHFPA